MNLRIEQASIDDAKEILELQYLCYQSEAALYDNYSIPPLKQSLLELKAEFANSVVLVCRLDSPTAHSAAPAGSRIVGSVRARESKGRCCIARLIVHPDMQRQGIGARLMAAIEDAFPAVSAFELFTGHRSEGNLRLYRRLGYRNFKVEPAGPGLKLVFLEKIPGEQEQTA